MSNRDQGFRVCVLSPEGFLDETATLAWQRAGVTNLRVCKSTDLNTDPPVPDAPDLVVVHHPDEESTSVIGRVHGAWPQVPVAVWSVAPSVRGAVEAIRHGAIDYLAAAPVPDGIEALIEKARTYRDRQNTARCEPEASPRDDDWPSVLGQSPAMKRLLREVQAVAAQDATVLLQGETGSGKERVARLIHRLGGRAAKPFIVCNCSAIVATLAESELFGHEKGAFTGARRAKAGLFEAARGGTLFFDQVQELPLTLQPKLLRVLENREFTRIGATRPMAADVRVIAAASRDLKDEVKAKAFREDLFYRLNTATLTIPSLRERREDIPLLVEHFLRTFSRQFQISPRLIAREAMSRLMEQPWEGNVRELRNVIERAVTLSRRRVITNRDLRLGLPPPKGIHASPELDTAALVSLDEIERSQIRRVLQMTGGNRERAAKALGLSRSTLYRRLAELGIQSS